ncbi:MULTISPECIES: hypothetical protein [unclassified Streptomyces]|uniref:hypothetical protein n=1 Tax=unclassified Streptomyces TaxID=2593676 RepID=UPI003637FC1D
MDPGYLTEESDLRRLIAGVRRAETLLASPAEPAAPPSPPGPRAPSDGASRTPEERAPVSRTPCWSSRGRPGAGTRPRACSPPN